MAVDTDGKTTSGKKEEVLKDKTAIAEGLWRKCGECDRLIFHLDLEENCFVCPHCDHHFKITAYERIDMLADKGSFKKDRRVLMSGDPLSFVDSKPYPDRLEESRSKSGMDEAVVWGTARIDGIEAVITVMEFRFMGGSMGSVVGETITRSVMKAIELNVPLVISCASGGARMQEGLFSLMQMAKTSAALGKLALKGLPYISILTDPTSGGVAASFATLADVIIAEMGAFVGFAGPRVIEQTIRETLPSGFQSSDFCMERGMIDCVIHRSELKSTIAGILKPLTKHGKVAQVEAEPVIAADREAILKQSPEQKDQAVFEAGGRDGSQPVDPAGAKAGSAWDIVQLSRHASRPRLLYYIEAVFDGFTELHGDRRYGDDRAIVGGTAYFRGIPVVLVGHNRGHGIYQIESWKNNNGMPHPEGIRKAQRMFRLAEKFGLPLITLVDTPGAYPGVGAEERGQALAIAESIQQMSFLRVPILSVIIGEGGSGGALSIAVANRVLIMENATFSVITPEGCAAILWRDSKHAPIAASALKMTSSDLLEYGLVDEIVPEPPGGAHESPHEAAEILSDCMYRHLKELMSIETDELLRQRYEKYTSIGVYREEEQ